MPLLFLAMTPILLAADPKPAEIDWLEQNAIPLKTCEAGHGFADLQPLKKLVGDARIVALGECTHGTREVFQMKHRLVEFLASEMGFTIFSIEANMPEAYRLNDFVLKGEGDVEELINGMYFWTWNTEEVRDMVLWMRDFNKSGKGRIEFTGNDMQTPTVAMQIVLDFLNEVEPGRADAAQTKYDLCKKGPFSPGTAGGGGFGVATGTFPLDAAKGRKIRYSGWIKTEGVTQFAGLWWRVDGPEGVLAFDNMSGRGPSGTSDWKEYAVELEVAEAAKNINFGVILPGDGKAWFDGLKVEIDGKPFADAAFDLDFEAGALKGLNAFPGPYETRLDDAVAKSGKKSLRLTRTSAPAQPASIDADHAAALCAEVLSQMESSRADYAKKKPLAEVDWAIQNARVVLQCAQMYSNAQSRDESMARNVKWTLDQAPPGTKLVLWAHNGHIAQHKLGPYRAQGSYLDEMFGKDYVAIGFAAGEGTYTAVAEGGLKSDNALSPPMADSFETRFRAAGLPIFALDLRKASEDEAASEWLTETRMLRMIGALAMEQQFQPTPLQELFDALIYIDKTNASRLLRRAGGRAAKAEATKEGARADNAETQRANEAFVRICPENEPGEALEFGGRVLDYAGRPLEKAAVMAYNTDARGLYNPPDSPTRVPRMRGVAITDREGRYRFRTVKPGSYPDSTEPAHIHMTILAPAHRVKYFDFWFEDDPHLTPEKRATRGVVFVRPEKNAGGVLTFDGGDVRLEGN